MESISDNMDKMEIDIHLRGNEIPQILENTQPNLLSLPSSFNLELLKSLHDTLVIISSKTDEEKENYFSNIEKLLISLNNSGYFSKVYIANSKDSKDNNQERNVSERDGYFINTFLPRLVKEIGNTNNETLSAYVREKQESLLNFLFIIFIQNLHNINLIPFFELLPDLFNDSKPLYKARSKNYNIGERFLELNYDILNPDADAWRTTLKKGDIIDVLDYEKESHSFSNEKRGYGSWTRGEIIDMDYNNQIKVRLLGKGDIISQISINSPIILPFNTLSHDFELRENIEKSTIKIDILDNKSWYLATILDLDNRKRAGKDYKWIKYGVRRYHKQANNRDSKQHTFYGFGEGYDKEISVHDPRIRMVHTFSKQIIHWEALNKYPTDNYKFNEVETYFPFVFNSKKFYAVGCRSDKEVDLNYIKMINQFGDLAGFEQILEFLDKTKSNYQQCLENLNYEKINSMIFIITEIIYNMHMYLHIEFTKNYIIIFITKIFDYFKNFSVNNENRNFKKEKIESTFKKLKEVMGKIYIETDLNWEYESFCLDFCINCLNSPILKKRLVGLKILTEIIQEISRNQPVVFSSSTSMTSSYEAHLPNKNLIEILRNANLLEIIYGGNSHLQLVEKSIDLFKALINAKLFYEEEISKFYNLYKESTDINMNMAIYKILKENMYPLGTSNQKFLLRLMLDNSVGLKESNLNDFKKNDSKGLKRDLELILSLHQKLPSYESAQFNVEIGNYFYYLLFNNQSSNVDCNEEVHSLDEEFFDNIMNETISLVRSWDFREYRVIFIEDILKRLKEGKDFTKTLIVLRRLLSGVSANLEEYQRNKIYFMMLDDYDIINCMINFMQESDKNDLQKKNDTKVIEFFSFMNFIISSANRKIIFKIEQILVLYFIFVENNGNLVGFNNNIQSSSSYMNKFFKFLLLADDKKMLPQNTFHLIFSKMVENKNLNLDNIDLELIKILWSIFLNVNRENKKLEYYEKGKTSSSSLNTNNFQFKSNLSSSNSKFISPISILSFNPEDLATIKILTNSPLELEGFDLIYKAVICTSSSILNIKDGISKICISNFIQLFKCYDKSSKERGSIWLDLLKKIIEDINLLKSSQNYNLITENNISIQSQLDSSTENKILNCISLIRALVQESEKYGTAGVIPHSSINKYKILSLKIINKFVDGSENYLYFEIKVSSNTTVWDVKRLLSKKLNTLPELIKISFFEKSESNDKDIKNLTLKEKIINEDENGKILSDFKFKDQDEIIIKKNVELENLTREALVDSDGNLTIKFQRILELIFFKFATHKVDQGNHAKIQNATNSDDIKMQSSENFDTKFMDTSDCANFIKYATNLEMEYEISPEDPRVLIFFMKYDIDKDGLLSLQDFFEFYQDQYNNKKPHIIWENLKNFGYKSDFKFINEPYEQYNSNKNLMPRYLLSKDNLFFNTIFFLHEIKGSETLLKESAKLLSFISTNPNVLRNILFLEKIEKEEDWEIYIGSNGDYYRQLYCLQIIESFFEDFESPFSEVDNEPIELSVLEEKDVDLLQKDYKILWLENFLVYGGFKKIINLFFNCDIQNPEVDDKDKSKLKKKCLNMLIKIIRNSLLIVINSSKIINNETSGINGDLERENVIRCIRKESISPENALVFEKGIEKNSNHSFQLNNNISKCDEISQYFTKKYNNTLLTSLLQGDSDIVKILSKILKLLKIIILKSETDNDERIFISTANNLFSLLYLSHNDISNVTQILFSSNIEYDYEYIINQGLLVNPHLLIRANFYKTLKNLSQNLHNLKEYDYIINLINIVYEKIFNLNTHNEMTNCKYLFSLVENLLSLSYNNKLIQENLKIIFPDMALKVFCILNDKENLEECVLLGFLKIISKFVDLDSKFKIILGENIIKILINKFLLKETNSKGELDSSSVSHRKHIELYNLNGDYQQNCNFINNSSQSEEIRNIIFSLITKLCESNFENLIQLFNTKIAEIPFSEEIKYKQKINSYNPIAERRSSCGYVGIKNLGCICYMNAMLQQFYMIPSFRFSLLQIDDGKVFTFSEENKDIDDNLLHQLQKMFTFLEMSDRVSYTPSEFCFSFKDFTGRRTNLTQQQDAQEFLGRIFDLLEFGIKNTENKYLLQSVFGGKTCSQLECKECGTKKRNFEDFYNLSLEVKNMKNIKNSLDKFISEEKIEGYYCETCKKNTTCSKKNTLAHMPNVLIMHLQRIGYNYDTGLNEKDNSRFEFPEILNLKQYSIEQNDCDKKQSKSEEKIKLTQENQNDCIYEREDEYYEYFLVGVVVHIGHADAGHYISYINTSRNGKESTWNRNNSNWLNFNDAYVSCFEFSTLEENCFGGNHEYAKTGFIGPVPPSAPPEFDKNFVSSNSSQGYANNYSGRNLADNFSPTNNQNGYANPNFKEAESGQSAYMLVYERVKKNPIKLVKSKNQVEEILNKNTNIKLMEISEQNTFKILKSLDVFKKNESNINYSFDDKNLAIKNTIIYDTTKNEYFQYIPFYEVQKLAPYNYYLDVLNDNIEFYNDQKIYNNSFNHFLENLLNIVEKILFTTVDDSYTFCELSYQPNNKNFKNSNQITFDKMYYINHIIEVILSYIFEVISKSYFKNSLTDIISKLITLIKSMPIISNSVINYLNSRKELLKDILFSTDESLNTGYKNLIITSIRSNLSFHESTQSNSAQNQPALTLLDSLIEFLPIEASRLWTKILSYLELFEELVICNDPLITNYFITKNLIAKLIDFFLGRESPFYEITQNRNEMGKSGVNAKFAPLISTISSLLTISSRELSVKEKLNQFLNEDIEMNVDVSNNILNENQISGPPKRLYKVTELDLIALNDKKFYLNAIKENYNNSALSKILAYMMKDNYNFSKLSIFWILESINKNITLQDAKNSFDLISEIVNLEDEYQLTRFEWLFGIPHVIINFNTGSVPTMPINVGRHGDKLYKYVSHPILYCTTSYDSLTERMFYKFFSSSDYLQIINLFLSNILFLCPRALVYFDSLPHPRPSSQIPNVKSKAIDYLFELAREEIGRYNNSTYSNSKNNEHLISQFENNRLKYEKIVYEINNPQEIKSETQLQIEKNFSANSLQPKLFSQEKLDMLNKMWDHTYSKGMIYSDIIYLCDHFQRKEEKDSFIDMTAKNLYLICIDMETDVGLMEDNTNINNNSASLDEKFTQEEKEKILQANNNKSTYQANFMSNNNSSNLFPGYNNNHTSSSNRSTKNVYYEPVNDGIEIIPSNFYTNKSEDEVYKNMCGGKLKPGMKYRRVLKNYKPENIKIRTTFRRYILYNPTEFDYKVKIKFHNESDKMNTYLPTTEIVVILKKFNGQNVITLTKADCENDYGNYLVETDIIPLEKSSIMLNAGSNTHFINVFLDEEKKEEEKKSEISDSSHPQKEEIKLIDENYAMQTDVVEIECCHCGRKNFVNDGSNYRCGFCHKDLFG